MLVSLNQLPASSASNSSYIDVYKRQPLQESNVIIYADTLAYASLQGHYPAELLKEATEEDFGTEFLDYKLAVKVVEGMDSAIAHIQQYGSKHSECIVTEDKGHAKKMCIRDRHV